MAKKKKVKLGTFGIVTLLLAAAGFVFAIIGIFIPWFSTNGSFLGSVGTNTEGYALFNENFNKLFEKAETFPLVVVQIFAISSVVLAGLSAVAVALKSFNIVKFGGLAKLLVAGLTIAAGIFVIVFSGTFAGDVSGGIEGFAEITTLPIVGMYFCAIGTIVSGAMLFLKR